MVKSFHLGRITTNPLNSQEILAMKTSPEGRKAIAVREGNILTAYHDTVGVITIGVGHTSAAGPPIVTPGMKITAEQSDEILSRDLVSVENDVNSAVKVPLTQNQFDALVSFVFNIGGTAFRNSTLLRKLNAKDYAGAADQFLVWVKQKELTGRRKAERAQFLAS
jgi:lysozyme